MPKAKKPRTDFSHLGQKSRSVVESSPSTSSSGVHEDIIDALVSLPEGSTLSLYFHELLCDPSAVSAVDGQGDVFLMKDFNSKTNHLFARKFIQIQRKKHSAGLLYICTCNPDRAKLLQTLAKDICYQFEDDSCLHIQVLDLWVQHVDALLGFCGDAQDASQCEDEDDTQQIKDTTYPVTSTSVYVCIGDSWGVVSMEGQQPRCSSCHGTCRHIKKLTSMAEDEESCPEYVADLLIPHEEATRRKAFQPSCLSYKRIEMNSEGWKDFHSKIITCEGCSFCAIEEGGTCPNCNEGLITKALKDVTLYSQYRRSMVKVAEGVCPSCQTIVEMDGSAHSILNMRSFLIGHDVLRDYLQHFMHGRMPLYSYFKVWSAHQLSMGYLEADMMSYFYFRHSWYSFLNLLELDIEEEFICTICKETPSIVLFDGTAVAFRKSYVPDEVFQSISSLSPSTTQKSNFADRCFISDVKTRQMLASYCNPNAKDYSFTGLKILVEKNCPSLVPVMEWIESTSEVESTAPKSVRSFLKDLSKKSPVCGFISPNESVLKLVQELKHLDVKKYPEKLVQLQRSVPSLFNLVGNLKGHSVSGSLPSAFDAVIDQLVVKAKVPFEADISNVAQRHPATENAFVNSVTWFPKLPVVRTRGVYPADHGTTRYTCRKQGKSHKSLLPGVVTMHCEHDICYGFQVMLRAESPDTVFSILRTRFPTAPNVVLYDFACGLHSYSLNREPSFFKESRFLIDRYHEPNHTGCSSGYRISYYPQLKEVNSQICEQSNARLARIKGPLSYMTPQNFMQHAKLFFWGHNRARRLKQT